VTGVVVPLAVTKVNAVPALSAKGRFDGLLVTVTVAVETPGLVSATLDGEKFEVYAVTDWFTEIAGA